MVIRIIPASATGRPRPAMSEIRPADRSVTLMARRYATTTHLTVAMGISNSRIIHGRARFTIKPSRYTTKLPVSTAARTYQGWYRPVPCNSGVPCCLSCLLVMPMGLFVMGFSWERGLSFHTILGCNYKAIMLFGSSRIRSRGIVVATRRDCVRTFRCGILALVLMVVALLCVCKTPIFCRKPFPG